jgi:hypothetical protein
MGSAEPILYVGPEKESQEAVTLLEAAGFTFEVKPAPNSYQVTYGTPVLFALSNIFEGVQGVQVFIENAKVLGHARSAAA